jgi:hypothetical protein
MGTRSVTAGPLSTSRFRFGGRERNEVQSPLLENDRRRCIRRGITPSSRRSSPGAARSGLVLSVHRTDSGRARWRRVRTDRPSSVARSRSRSRDCVTVPVLMLEQRGRGGRLDSDASAAFVREDDGLVRGQIGRVEHDLEDERRRAVQGWWGQGGGGGGGGGGGRGRERRRHSSPCLELRAECIRVGQFEVELG